MHVHYFCLFPLLHTIQFPLDILTVVSWCLGALLLLLEFNPLFTNILWSWTVIGLSLFQVQKSQFFLKIELFKMISIRSKSGF